MRRIYLFPLLVIAAAVRQGSSVPVNLIVDPQGTFADLTGFGTSGNPNAVGASSSVIPGNDPTLIGWNSEHPTNFDPGEQGAIAFQSQLGATASSFNGQPPYPGNSGIPGMPGTPGWGSSAQQYPGNSGMPGMPGWGSSAQQYPGNSGNPGMPGWGSSMPPYQGNVNGWGSSMPPYPGNTNGWPQMPPYPAPPHHHKKKKKKNRNKNDIFLLPLFERQGAGNFANNDNEYSSPQSSRHANSNSFEDDNADDGADDEEDDGADDNADDADDDNADDGADDEEDN